MAALGACVLFFCEGARANDAAPRLHLTYEAPAECPSQAELEEQLLARVPSSWLLGADTRRFDVRIMRDASDGFSGRLVVEGAGREPKVREIRAPQCREVSTSIAIFLAIALDPTTEQEPASPPAAEPARGSSPGPGAVRVAPAPAQRLRGAVWTWSSGYHVTYLRATEPAWGGRVYAELVRSAAPGAIAPAARLSWGWSDFSVSSPRAGEAKFRLRTARLEGCALVPLSSLLPRSALALSPCAALDVGSLEGRTPELPGAGHGTIPWTAAGAVVRARWALARWLSLEIDGGLLVPLQRKAFALAEPFRFVYRPPGVVFEGGAGACVSGRF